MRLPLVVPFATAHLSAALALCEAEGWPSFVADPARAQKILTAPGASSLVALDDGNVIGFAFAVVDAGALDAYLSMLVVAHDRRREGIARMLMAALFLETGVERIDLLAEPGAEAFYDSFPHKTFRGYRIYPESR